MGIHWVDAAAGSGTNLPCENLVSPAPTPTGDHNTGIDCMNGCHNHGFTIAGTLYASATGNVVFAGAHVTITDANNQVIDMVVSSQGNFNTTRSMTFPVTILASSCPSAVAMVASATTGHCNQAGCHPGGTSLKMHLP